MGTVLRVFGRFGAVLAVAAPVFFRAAPGVAADDCLGMPDGQVICNPTPEDEEFFKESSNRPLLAGPTRRVPQTAACRVDDSSGTKGFSFTPDESLDVRLCALMLATGALPFGASHTDWLNPELSFSSRSYPVFASIRLQPEDPQVYISRTNPKWANRFWPFHLKRMGGPPLRYTLVAYRPSQSAPIEQLSAAEQMRLCAHDFQEQIRKAETFLGHQLSPYRQTLLERGIFTISDSARRPGYFIEGTYIRMEIWLGLMSPLNKGRAASGLCRPFLFFQDLGTS